MLDLIMRRGMMKRIKIGIVIVIGLVTVYCIVSYSIFFMHKPSIDAQLHIVGEEVQEPISHQAVEKTDQVIIQNISHRICQHGDDCYRAQDQGIDDLLDKAANSSEIIVTQEAQRPLALVMAEPEEEVFITNDDQSGDQNPEVMQSYSFMTMPIDEQSVIDLDTQATLEDLIGNDVDEFVKLVLQSNNNIVSKEACRSCGMYAFFNGIKNHKPMSSEDIRILQKLLLNLYQFTEKMKKLSGTTIMLPEQYDALEDLHRSQAIKNDIKLQARLAVTSAALKKLQNIKYNR